MPRYKVLEPGFHEGKTYSPTGKRKVVHMDKPFPNAKVADNARGYKKGDEMVPSWFERIQDETAAEKKKRLAAEKAAAEAANEKAKEDDTERSIMSFAGDADGVETL